MIRSHSLTRLTASVVSLLCLFCMSSLVFAQGAAQTPAASPANKPAPAAKPAQPAPASKPAVDKPLSFRFTEIEKDSDEDRIRNQTGTIINKGKFEKTEDKAIFTQYYKEYFFARWVNSGKYYQMDAYPETLRKQARLTRKPTDKKKLEAIASRWTYPCFIEDFRKDLDRSRDDGEPQKIAVKIAYDFAMEVIASNNSQCTPAVKYNCTLLLGNLYYKTSASANELPVVYAPAFETLVKIASSAKAPCYLKIGALMGLNQMISETNLTDKQKTDVYNVMLEIAKTKVDPATFASSKDDPTGEGAAWARNLSIEGLRLLADFNSKIDKTKGFYPGKEAVGTLFQIINDKKAPMTTRVAALESLGSYNFNKYPELKSSSPKLLKAVASLVIEAIQTELDRKVDNLVWGDDAERINRQYGSEDSENENVDNSNNAIFLLQRAMPAVYAVNTALNGVKSDKGWKGLSSLESSSDAVKPSEMIDVLKNANASLNALSKEIIPSNDAGGAADLDSEDSYATNNKLQEVISVLNSIQDDFRPFTE